MDKSLLLKETQSDYFVGLIDKKIVYSSSASPIVIENAQFFDLKGCVSIITSDTINISHTLFIASYIAIAVYISSTSNVFVDRTCVSSCMSSTSPSQTGDVFSIETSQSLVIDYCSLTNCITNLSTYPSGYADHIKGSAVEYENHNTSFCYGISMPGDHISASSLTYKNCYSGHTKSGFAFIQLIISTSFLIKNIVVESAQALNAAEYGLYACNCLIPIIIEDCIFLKLEAKYELFTSNNSLTANGCTFSSSSPSLGSNVIASPNLNYFGITSQIDVASIRCYENMVSYKQCIQNIPIIYYLYLILN